MTTLRHAAEMAKEALKEIYENATSFEDSWAAAVAEPAIAALDAALAQEPTAEPIGTEWTPCVKLPITVHVREQREGETHVSTREGITPVKPDDLIMRGVAGEEYPIGRELFNRTYRMEPRT
jgi:hypothetical protein